MRRSNMSRTSSSAGTSIERSRKTKALSLPPVVAGYLARIPQVQVAASALAWMLCNETCALVGFSSRLNRTASDLVQDRASAGWSGPERDKHMMAEARSVPLALCAHRILHIVTQLSPSFRMAVATVPAETHPLMLHTKSALEACIGRTPGQKPQASSNDASVKPKSRASKAASEHTGSLAAVPLTRTSS